jgi:NAD(P)H dehydrogenase (quinone)
MRCLLVFAHPLEDSLNGRLCRFIRSSLEAAGHDVTCLDLYRLDYDPRLTPEERRRHDGSDPGTLRSPDADELERAEALVLVFPTWWFGMPAMLKGWIDRTFSPGVAFHQGGEGGLIRPGLGTLRHFLVVTTLGSPWWLGRIVMQEPLRRTLRWGVARACAPKAKFRMLSLYSAEKVEEQRVEAFESRIAAVLPGT